MLWFGAYARRGQHHQSQCKLRQFQFAPRYFPQLQQLQGCWCSGQPTLCRQRPAPPGLASGLSGGSRRRRHRSRSRRSRVLATFGRKSELEGQREVRLFRSFQYFGPVHPQNRWRRARPERPVLLRVAGQLHWTSWRTLTSIPGYKRTARACYRVCSTIATKAVLKMGGGVLFTTIYLPRRSSAVPSAPDIRVSHTARCLANEAGGRVRCL